MIVLVLKLVKLVKVFCIAQKNVRNFIGNIFIDINVKHCVYISESSILRSIYHQTNIRSVVEKMLVEKK